MPDLLSSRGEHMAAARATLGRYDFRRGRDISPSRRLRGDSGMPRDGGGGGGGSGALNVLGGALESCSLRPATGFFRDGCCNTSAEDIGSHTVCVVMTAEFLAFSKASGNDLSTPVPAFGFPGLQPGD